MVEIKELERIATAIATEPTTEKKRTAFARIAKQNGWPDIFAAPLELNEEELLTKTGIYRVAAPGGRIYVGQTRVTFAKRFFEHRSGSSSRLVKASIEEHGAAAHVFEAVELVDDSAALDEREGAWLDAVFAADFAGLVEKMNLSPSPSNNLGLKRSAEVIARHSRTMAEKRERVAAETAAALAPAEDGLPRINGLVRLSQFREAVGFSDVTIYRMVKAGRFPQPFMASKTLRLWRTEDLREWMRVGPDEWKAAHPLASSDEAA
jgi:predicted DNA-binding transcriptional regulator AlpA